MVEVGDGGFATEFEQLSYLVYADRPEHIRAAGGPWAGVARVVDHASAVLEDGRAKLTEVWRSPAGQLYMAKMGEVAQAMREVSVVARHNGRVMEAAAEALDAKQKDFAVLSTAPIPSDALERYARAIVKSLDESYQQAVADFRPVPPAPEPDIGQDPPRTGNSSHSPSRHDAAEGGRSTPSDGLAVATSPQQRPSWVPTQADPATGPSNTSGSASTPGGGPMLQGTPGQFPGGGGTPTSGGPGSLPGTSGGSRPFIPGPQPPAVVGGLPFGSGWSRAGRASVPTGSVGARPRAGQQPLPPGRSRALGGPYPEDPVRPALDGRTGPAGRAGTGHPGAMLGGIPTGGVGGIDRSWQGYRRPAERFPTSRQATVEPVIGAVSGEEPEQVSTDYYDEDGNQITIRRLA